MRTSAQHATRAASRAAAARPWLASLVLHGGALAAMCVLRSSVAVDVGWQHESSGAMVWVAARDVRIEVPDVPPPAPPARAEPVDVAPDVVVEPDQLEVDPPLVEPAQPPLDEPDEPPRRIATAAELARTVAPRPPKQLVEQVPEPAPVAKAVASDAATTVQASPLAGENAPPRYPFVPWRRGIEGTVVIELDVGANGAVTAARVAVSSGNATLDESARSCLQTWHFTPARKAGAAIACTVRQSVVFRIRDPQVGVGIAQ